MRRLQEVRNDHPVTVRYAAREFCNGKRGGIAREYCRWRHKVIQLGE